MIPGIVGKIYEAPVVTAAANIGGFRQGELVRVSGSTTIATIGPPMNGGFSGLLFVVPGTDVATTTSGNILTAVTMPANRVTLLVYVDSLAKWSVGAIS